MSLLFAFSCAPSSETAGPPNYADGVELQEHTLAWAYATLLDVAHAEFDPDARARPRDLLGVRGRRVGHWDVCLRRGLRHGARLRHCDGDGCRVVPDVYYTLQYIEDWRVDSPEAIAGIDFAEQFASAAVYPNQGEACAADPGHAILSFTDRVSVRHEVNGVTGEVCPER